MDEYKHVARHGARAGPGVRAADAGARRSERYPFLETHDLEGALWDPLDGDIDPSQLTQAFAKGARELGCRIKRFTRVTGLQRQPRANGCVDTDKGDIDLRDRGQCRRLSGRRDHGHGRPVHADRLDVSINIW